MAFHFVFVHISQHSPIPYPAPVFPSSRYGPNTPSPRVGSRPRPTSHDPTLTRPTRQQVGPLPTVPAISLLFRERERERLGCGSNKRHAVINQQQVNVNTMADSLSQMQPPYVSGSESGYATQHHSASGFVRPSSSSSTNLPFSDVDPLDAIAPSTVAMVILFGSIMFATVAMATRALLWGDKRGDWCSFVLCISLFCYHHAPTCHLHTPPSHLCCKINQSQLSGTLSQFCIRGTW